MKKKIFVNFILFLELVVIACYVINLKFISGLNTIFPFNYVISIASLGHNFLTWLANILYVSPILGSLLGFNMPVIEVLIVLLACNLAWIIVFYIIFGTIGVISRKVKTKKRRKIISPYKLTPTEEKKFAPANYRKKATKWVNKTMIVPILVIALFLLARFDKAVIDNYGLLINNSFGLNIYTNYVVVILDGIINPLQFNHIFQYVFTNKLGIGYFDLVNSFLSSLTWAEYVVLGLACVLILLVWFLVFKLIALVFRGPRSKKLARKAKNRYIEKMEKVEYKLRKKYKEDAVAKGDEFLNIIEEELKEDALVIAKIKEDKTSRYQKKIDAKKKAYLEEIGYGVVDLGVSRETPTETKEPIIEREIRYISDADVDIILDEEPVIEIVVDDDMEEVELSNKEDDLFFEKYQEDDVDLELVEETKASPTDVMEYVQSRVQLSVEKEVEENISEEIEIEEVEEIKVEEVKEDVVEEPIAEEVEETSKEVEESKKYDPFAAYRNRVNKGHGSKKVPSFKSLHPQEEKAPVVKTPVAKTPVETKPAAPIKKANPFDAYKNQPKKAGSGSKKVPSFKETKEQTPVTKSPVVKAPVEAKPAAPVKKANPFYAYKNQPKKAGSGSKKVPPIKKEEPKVEKKVEPKVSKNDPFAAYRNRIKEKNTSTKK